ncbi:MAG: hypothetical protein IT318_25525 [Anaerolineales bacterium]|nr:hypothetical protein [Anaerolineales bacterium]
MPTSTAATIGFAATSLAFGLIGVLAYRCQRTNRSLATSLAAAAGISLVANLALAAAAAGRLAALPAGLRERLATYATVAMAIVFTQLTQKFLRPRRPDNLLFWISLLSLVVLVGLDSPLLGTDPALIRGADWLVPRSGFIAGMLAVLWGMATAWSLLLTLRAYHRTPQPLHRNRQVYWSLALALSVAAAALVWSGLTVAGSVLWAAAFGLAALCLLSRRLPDARRAVYGSGASACILMLAVGAYLGGVLLAGGATRWLPLVPVWAWGIAVALALVLGVNPLLRWLEQSLRRRLSGRQYDPKQLIGEYSLSISNIVDLEQLAATSLELIANGLGLQQAALFVVDNIIEPEAAAYLRLRRVGSLGPDCPAAGTLLNGSPLAEYWRTEYAPLTQYDIDVEPRYERLSPVERIWLEKLNMDVFVPIYASQDWIGLLALGPKLSRHRYFDEELELLSTLADQTSVALRNARLVDDLVRLNRDLQAAYAALDEANQRLSQLDRAKSDFINVMSHELRTPLAILYGYSQILLEELAKRGETGSLQLVEGMATGVDRLNGIIEAMLDMAQIDSQALHLRAQPVRIVHLVQKLAWQIQWALRERNLRLELIDLDDLPPVDADPDALLKALHHLVSNGIKFTPDGGQITISGRCVPEALSGGALEVTVADTGIGIDPRFLELIFDKFYQAGEVALHSSGKSKFKGGGPGLGLAIARGIIEAHGGTLRAESSGHDEAQLPGSRFLILMPISPTTVLQASGTECA